ncbi:MAG TPA: flagellar biosynthetic protein FliO [Planctomycetaceae bacterium]|nr:flagellar biosynthetic protein FliO [Planctomycetaceae bacterium]
MGRWRRPLTWGLTIGCWLMLAACVSAEPRRLNESSETRSRPLPARSHPAPTTTGSSNSLPASTSVWGSLIGLAVVAGGLLIASRWLRVHGPAGLRGLPNEAVEALGQRVLSRGVAVHLVRCGSRMLVLGVGPDGVRTLSEITDPVEVDLLAGACRRRDETVNGASFSQLFSREAAPARNPDARSRRSFTEPADA